MAGCDEPSFTFIPVDSRSAPAQEAIRAHIMRHRHRQARRGGKRPQVRLLSGKFNERLHFWKSQESQTGRLNDPQIPRTQDHAFGDESLQTWDSVSDQDSCPVHGGGFALSLIQAKPTLGQVPLGVDKNVEEMLLQHYLRYGGGSEITNQLLRVYCETKGSFSAFLAIIATNYGDEQGQDPPLDTAELENRALREVSTQISHSPTVPASSTMLTVAMLASLRECRHESDVANCHWSALKQMVDINGGLYRLRMHRDLYGFLLLIEAVVLSATSCSLAQLSGVPSHVVTARHELLDFLGSICQHIRTAANTPAQSTLKVTSAITDIFLRSSHKKDLYSIGKWYRGRVACLLFLAVLNLHGNCQLQDDPCYQAIEAEVLSRGTKYTVYPEELYLVIIHKTNRDDLCQLAWKAARLLCAVKQFCQRNINTCHRLLTAYLGVPDPFGLTMVLDECDDLVFRAYTPT